MVKVNYILRISKVLARTIRLQALESHPLEIMGDLIGMEEGLFYTVEAFTTTTLYEERTRWTMCTKDGQDDLWDLKDLGLTDMQILGNWHSHPDAPPILSRPKDVTAAERKRNIQSDFEGMEDGAVEYICGLKVSKRQRIQFSERAYIRIRNRARLMWIQIF